MSDERFQVFDSLQRHNTRLRDSTRLGNGVGLASWYNEQDLIDLENAD
ncbi:MAG TPA: AraC family transcriptional regulator, partial [Pseudomonas sp.]|nr:AraC family transcriptional regulator [Pseudomonas sp.]